MSTYNVPFSELDALLQSLPANTVDTPYDIYISSISSSQITGSVTAQSGTLQYVLQQNNTKYVDLNLPSSLSSRNMNYNFKDCVNLVSITAKSWMFHLNHTFHGCTNLKYIKGLFGVNYNENNLDYAFYNCSSLESVDLSNIRTGSISYAFYNCGKLKSLSFKQFLGGRNNDYCFANCTQLTDLDLGNSDIYKYGVVTSIFKNSGVTDIYVENSLAEKSAKYFYNNISSLFGDDSKIGAIKIHAYSPTWSKLNLGATLVSGVVNVSDYNFFENNYYAEDPLQILSTSKQSPAVIKLNSQYDFIALRNLEAKKQYYLNDSTTPTKNTESTVYMSDVFVDFSLTEIPNSVTSVSFSPYSDKLIKSPVLSSSGITSIQNAFTNCTNLEEVPAFVSSITSAQNAFKGCTSLTEATIENGGNITDASSMFEGCTALETADISSMTSLDNATAMFKGCTSLTEVIK